MFTETESAMNSLPVVPSRGHCIDCPMHRSELLTALTGEDVDSCGFDTHPLDARAPLRVADLSPGTVVVVRRGMIIRTRTDHSGHSTAVDALGSGAAFIVPERGQQTGAYSVGRSLYCTIAEGAMVERLKSDHHALLELHHLHAGVANRLERFSDARGRSNVRSRVAATLCALVDTLSPGKGRKTHLSSALLQRDIAALASTRHESVCRILREFSEAGSVRHGPDGIHVLEYDRLRQL